MLEAWTEVCHQIFGGWELQTMGNLQKNVMCTEKNVLIKKNLMKQLNPALPLWGWVENTEVDIHWVSNKEKILSAVVSKEGHADSLHGHDYWFLWKNDIVIASFLIKIRLIKWILYLPTYTAIQNDIKH